MRSMRRPELWRTTTFRLALVFGAVFAAGVVALIGLIWLSAAGFITRQMDEIVLGQAHALQATAPRDLPAVMLQIQNEDSRHVNFCALFSPSGARIAGNVAQLPAGLPVDGKPRELRAEGFQPGARALAARLPTGEILFVGFDAKVLSGLRAILLRSLL